MSRKILLTGRPGCGKTTLIKRVAKNLAQRAAGFYTEEIRDRSVRVGFKIVTLDGDEAVLAHVDFKTSERLGKYGLDLSALEAIGVKAIRDAVNEALDSEMPLLATIYARSLPFTDAIKSRPDVIQSRFKLTIATDLSRNFPRGFRAESRLNEIDVPRHTRGN